jgi:pimeloyl-ACP methyl ester carboxylesterase
MQDQYVDVNGCKLRYRDTGGPGVPILLTHGITGSLELWDHQLQSLGTAHRLIAWDAPNHGLSDLTGRTEDFDSYAAWALRFADAIGLQAFVAGGNSMGAAMSLRLAGLAPDRIKGLILANAATLGREVTPVFKLFSLPGLGEVMNKPSEKVVTLQIGAIVKDPACVSPELRQVLLRNAFKPGATAAFLATLRSTLGLRGQKAAVWEKSARLLDAVRCPTLIIHGRKDAVIPAKHSEDAVKRVSHARLLLLDDCGHTPQIEQPAVFNAALREFLAPLT